MKRYAHYRAIEAERRGRLLVLTLNRPDALNAVNAELHTELSRIFIDAREDPDCDVVMLTGAGRAFCAGGDLDWMQLSIDQPAMFDETAREAKAIVFGQLDLDKPLICRLNGHAVGLGASLALLCDVIIAADNAKIGDPHVSVGLVAGDGGALIWPQLIGYAKAKHYLFTGDLMTAAEAEKLGLITQVVAAADLDAMASAYAERLLEPAAQGAAVDQGDRKPAVESAVSCAFRHGGRLRDRVKPHRRSSGSRAGVSRKAQAALHR